jgi:hypothetical protein
VLYGWAMGRVPFFVTVLITGLAAQPPAAQPAHPLAPMPPGGAWTGVYYSMIFGMLHIVQEGGAVNGRWQRPRKDSWGELSGTAVGGRLDFRWTEHTGGTQQSGTGYFVYRRPAGPNVDDVLEGELGQTGGSPTSWQAIKQRNVRPDLQAVGNSGSPEVGGGDWGN